MQKIILTIVVISIAVSGGAVALPSRSAPVDR